MAAEVNTEDLELALLLEAIYRRYHYDFRDYAKASLKRRVTQALPRLGCRTITALQEKILHEPDSFGPLLQYLTVQVSDLFRDPGYYSALRASVLPVLATYPSIKIWVAGCSTGEEAYSLAILLDEEGLLSRAIIYATDINQKSLRAAESGIYTLERMRAFTGNYQQAGGRRSLADYYHAAQSSAIMLSRLRGRITFSDHSLATDHVFSEVHLVSCRNVLIYFDRDLQARALGLFVEALCPRGFLGLGSRETVRFTAVADEFAEVDGAARIYRKQH